LRVQWTLFDVPWLEMFPRLLFCSS
jgi:hypothetical protein